MRAEAQGHIDQINAATSLLRRFLDWDRALKRLDELNARVEDSTLWDDPKAAQDVMRERRRLEEAIGATTKIESELTDTVELIDMAEAEGETRVWQDVRQRLGDFLAAAETAALRDAIEMARLRFDSVYLICPSHNRCFAVQAWRSAGLDGAVQPVERFEYGTVSPTAREPSATSRARFTPPVRALLASVVPLAVLIMISAPYADVRPWNPPSRSQAIG